MPLVIILFIRAITLDRLTLLTLVDADFGQENAVRPDGHHHNRLILLHLTPAPRRSNMQRVYASVDDDTLHRLDDLAGAQKVHRSDVVSKAIESYLHLADAEESTQSSEADLQRQAQEIAHLQKLLEVRESEIQHLRSMTNDLRSLADTMAGKFPALPPSQDEARAKHWWAFWR
jgi:predicted transcriptional regulator